MKMNDFTQLRLAVIIPVYNRQALVVETLASVRAQTVAPWRVVVVDDGSTDGSPEAVEAWLAAHPMACDVQVVRQENAGVSVARNRGAKEAQDADLLAFLDSDDLWPADFVAGALQEFAQHPEWVAATSDRDDVEIDAAGQEVARLHRPWLICGVRATRAIMTGAFPNPPATVMRAAIFQRLGGYQGGVHSGEDAILAMLISTQGVWGHIVTKRPVEMRKVASSLGANEAHLPSRKSSEAVLKYVGVLQAQARMHGCESELAPAIAKGWLRAGKALKQEGQKGAGEDFETLKRKFIAGWRMRWRHMQGIALPDCFVGMDYWELVAPEAAEGTNA